MKESDNKFVLKAFIFWRLLSFAPIVIAPLFFNLQRLFLGGGYEKYILNPYLWSWANFDGEHYMSIAKMGYSNGEQAFFPLYPLLIKLLNGNVTFLVIISSALFYFALLGIYKLVSLDFSSKIAKYTILLILFFPTSFYFSAIYTESLFLCLSVWSFYFFRKEKYLFSGLLGLLTSATRVVGIALLPAYFLYTLVKEKKLKVNNLPLFIIPAGIMSYMYYSYIKWGDFIKFFNVASSFGEQRSDHLILLPQVFYRYIFKIIPNLTWSYFPVVFTTLLEVGVATLFLYLILIGFRKIKLDYWIYMLLIYIIPTLSGSFSSLPRYVVVSFPAFIVLSLYIERLNKYMRIGIYVIMAIIAVIAQMLFVQGYFVS